MRRYYQNRIIIMNIILGSSSPRRKELLKKIIDQFDISVPEIGEDIIQGELPIQYSERLSAEKANSIFPSLSKDQPSLLISCDTIVTLDNLIFGKPHNYNDAIDKLRFFSGKTHVVISSITLIHKELNTIIRTDSEKSFVTFKNINDDDINDYLNKINYMDKAGGYAIQEYGEHIINKINGSISNIIGFPLRLFFRMLYELSLLEKIFFKH